MTESGGDDGGGRKLDRNGIIRRASENWHFFFAPGQETETQECQALAKDFCIKCITRRSYILVTRHTSHVTRHTLHVTRHTSHVTRHNCNTTCRNSWPSSRQSLLTARSRTAPDPLQIRPNVSYPLCSSTLFLFLFFFEIDLWRRRRQQRQQQSAVHRGRERGWIWRRSWRPQSTTCSGVMSFV
jgi:hypothetical protein